jgi:hypothetical protein
LCDAIRNASLVISSDTPLTSKITLPGLTENMKYSIDPDPDPIGVPRALFVTGLDGKTLI